MKRYVRFPVVWCGQVVGLDLCVCQLGRVAKSIKTLPSFTKKLAIVLTAVSGLVDPYSSLFLSEKALKAIVHPAAARVQESQLERKATGIAIDFQAADMAVLATQASTPAASTLTSSSPE
jgi:hypothetical protein